MAQERWADAVDTPTSSISEPCGPTPAVAMLVVVPDTLRMVPMQCFDSRHCWRLLVQRDQRLRALLSVLLTLAAGCVQARYLYLLHFVMKSIPSLGGCSSFCVTCLSVETCACKSNCMFVVTPPGCHLPACAGFKCLPFMESSFEVLAFALHARHTFVFWLSLYGVQKMEHLNEKNLVCAVCWKKALRFMFFLCFRSCQHLDCFSVVMESWRDFFGIISPMFGHPRLRMFSVCAFVASVFRCVQVRCFALLCWPVGRLGQVWGCCLS